MKTYLATIALIFVILLGGIAVERLYRRFAARHPQLGPFRKEGKPDCCACTAGSGCDGVIAPADCGSATTAATRAARA